MADLTDRHATLSGHDVAPMPAADSTSSNLNVAIVGGGPAGLMAAQTLAQAGVRVDLFDAMPSVGRKFLLAGKGGLNLTHSEPLEPFVSRFGSRRDSIGPLLKNLPPEALRDWARGLGIETFVGSSGRVFPRDMKAAPLLRAWLHRLRSMGVRLHMRHRCQGVRAGSGGELIVSMHRPAGSIEVRAEVVLLALGGASWPQLGSDGAWVDWLQGLGADVAPLEPSNCGFDVAREGTDGALNPGWSEHFRSRFAGKPLKTVALSVHSADGSRFVQRGEFVITQGGVEGSLVYAASSALRSLITAQGRAVTHLDLLADRDAASVLAEVARPRGSRSMATNLKSRLRIDGVKAALLHELLPRETFSDAAALAAAIKSLPLTLVAPRPVAESISTAGGVRFESLDEHLMLRALPGVFCAGEMLDWEAPTGGYLLSACFATGVAAARGALAYLESPGSKSAGVSSIGAPCGVRSAA
jgi:uncharacterized flavoprotein (TIGR03862 family)